MMLGNLHSPLDRNGVFFLPKYLKNLDWILNIQGIEHLEYFSELINI